MIEKEFLSGLLASMDNVSLALGSNFKDSYLDYANPGFSPKREVFRAIIAFYYKYQNIVGSTEIETFLRSRKMQEAEIKATLLLFEEVRLVKATKSFEFIVDDLKESYAKDVLHKQLTSSADKLIQNDLHTALDEIKKGLYQSEAALLEELSEGSIKDAVPELVQSYKNIQRGIIKPGIPTGFPTVDRLAGGLKSGELDVIIGGSSEGKSCMMINIAHNVVKQGRNVLFISIELPRAQILRRYLSLDAGINCNRIRDGILSPEEATLYAKSLMAIKANTTNQGIFYIVDQPLCNAANVAAKLTELSVKFKVDLVVVDYMGIMQASVATKQGWQDLGNIGLELRKVARVFKVPILTAMQVTKESQKSKAETYELTDMALSNLVAYHADSVISLKLTNPEVLRFGVGVCDLRGFISKCRDGNKGIFNINADFSCMKMAEAT